MIRPLEEKGVLCAFIEERRRDIAVQKEQWRPVVDQMRSGTDAPFYQAIADSLAEGTLSQASGGAGAAYFLKDLSGESRFVVKPVDEDILCLNNSKHVASPFAGPHVWVREDIPLYRSAQTDVMAYDTAVLMGLERITPKTVMDIIDNPAFFDLSTRLEGEERARFLERAGKPDSEKLCSVQQYLAGSFPSYEVLEQWMSDSSSSLAPTQTTALAEHIDQTDYEDFHLFIWTTFDNDAHMGNARAYVKSTAADGAPVYGIRKIDNGLSFPVKNTHLVNYFSFLPNGERPLSDRARTIVRAIPLDALVERLRELDMENATDALVERVEVLQELVQRENLSIYEIDLRLQTLAVSRELALSPLSCEELERELETFHTTSYPDLALAYGA
jgi:hypothetical protein